MTATDSARTRACGIISGSRVQALEAAGLEVVELDDAPDTERDERPWCFHCSGTGEDRADHTCGSCLGTGLAREPREDRP